ncbi:regulator of Vps4 activity in the MVB pathway-domain-containing protein [Hygrophoropsis aurantiaca]|uniref:Regulator of Vps4 activity in the MVB pathway-domain-containing protein n=1 Tax=Hygrophoropsis aurantiaca TaxID=72124 RepID=A0ACB8APX5_9AGAM|nr:regulator of Vps4 activity in the MVB pathway-domain-containing protein [Hygrophoropsis aurantiaca]
MSDWDPNAIKVLLRQTAQRLGQLQERKDSQTQITRRDIAKLLQQGNIELARAKAQNLIHDDATSDLLEMVEMYVGVVIEHVAELAEGRNRTTVTVEAASNIVFAAPHMESRELNVVREMLIQRMGPEFARITSDPHNTLVSPKIIQMVSIPLPSVARINDCLYDIAKAYGIRWSPEPRREDILHSISEILGSQSSPIVDLPRLRKLCSQGIPDDPPWLRPRIWRLFFGTLPVLKSTWVKETEKQRNNYYELVTRILSPVSDSAPPSTHLTLSDATILNISESLSRLPVELFCGLESEPDRSHPCPLDDSADQNDMINCSKALDSRLQEIRGLNTSVLKPVGIPEIRLEIDNPHFDQSTPASSVDSIASFKPNAPTTLLHSNLLTQSNAHPKHLSSLLRLLYLHSSLNPANQSPHLPSLLVPLYCAVTKEVEPQDVAHAEADTFWLFEAIIGEFSELEDEGGGKVWMKKFGQRLLSVDPELSESLHIKGLDPALPHYSYRWLATLLTQTLPLGAVYPVWDVLFSYPMRTRDIDPKLEFLVDVCTSLLIRARTPLFRLGKPQHKAPGLWNEEHIAFHPPSPLRPWELSDAFLEGMTLLQSYPINSAGGIERVLQTANDLAERRIQHSRSQKSENLSLSARLKNTMWKGFTNQVTTAEESPEESDEESEEDSPDDGNETETPDAPGLTSRLTNTMWRGITNQSSMEVPPSPTGSSSPLRSSSPPPVLSLSPSQQVPEPPEENTIPTPPSQNPGLWSYAGKFKDSDTIATFTKVSTNWRAKALNAWSNRQGTSLVQNDMLSPSSTTSELPPATNRWIPPDSESHPGGTNRRGSLPDVESSPYSPPPRPSFFRSPRESFLPQPRRQEAPTNLEMSSEPDSSYVHKSKASLASLTAFQSYQSSSPPTQPKSGPRPLLLNSHSLLTAPKSPRLAHLDNSVPNSRGQWSEVMLAKGHALRQASVTSLSSLSPSEALNRPYARSRTNSRSDHDSDGGSRRVAINRKSVSPMAPLSRSPRPQWMPPISSVNSPDIGSPSAGGRHGLGQNLPTTEDTSKTRSDQGIEVFDSPTTISSPAIPHTPVTAISSGTIDVHIVNDSHHHGSSLSFSDSPLEPPTPSRIVIRKKTPPPQEADRTSDSSLSQTPSSRGPRVRSKKYVTRPTNIRTRENIRAGAAAEHRTLNPNDGLDEIYEIATTPRASHFGSSDPSSASSKSPHSPTFPPSRKSSNDTESRLPKLSNENDSQHRKGVTEGYSIRNRKVSTSSREPRRRESAAEEGDDEGYDDLLSAYESEDNRK